MLEFKTAFPATTEEAVRNFEQLIGEQLPIDYRNFLLAANGGQPVNGDFVAGEWGGTLVHCFYGLSTGYDAYNLDWSRSAFSEELPEAVTPIACDPGGYIVCLGVQGSVKGKVYFWDRGEKLDTLIALAPSFEEFIDELQPPRQEP